MLRVTKARIAAATFVGLGASVGGTLGFALSEETHQNDLEAAQEYEQEIIAIEDSRLELDYTSDQVVAQVGESCLRFLREYGPEGSLEDTEEDTAVSDLLGLTDQPCGTETTEVRSNFRDYVTSESTLSGSDARIADLEAKKNEKIESISDTDRVLALMGGVAFGMTITGILAVIPYDIAYDHSRDKVRGSGKK